MYSTYSIYSPVSSAFKFKKNSSEFEHFVREWGGSFVHLKFLVSAFLRIGWLICTRTRGSFIYLFSMVPHFFRMWWLICTLFTYNHETCITVYIVYIFVHSTQLLAYKPRMLFLCWYFLNYFIVFTFMLFWLDNILPKEITSSIYIFKMSTTINSCTFYIRLCLHLWPSPCIYCSVFCVF